jgi:hypothetical protein
MGSAPGSADGKDFLEQLRTVHFSLAIICVTAVVVVNLPKSVNLSTAENDLDKIINAVQPSSWSNKIIGEAGEEVAKSHGECTAHKLFSMDFPNGVFVVDVVRMWDIDYHGVPLQWDDKFLPIVDAPTDISEFQRIWDSEGTLRCPGLKVVTKKLWAIPNPTVKDPNPDLMDLHHSLTTWEDIKGGNTKEFVVVDKDVKGWPHTLLAQNDDGTGFRYVIEVSSAAFQNFDVVSARSKLFAHFSGVPNKRFAEAFPDLGSAAIGREGIALGLLKAHLQRLQNTNKEAFEAFGVKFPLAAVQWAAMLIVATQAIFWIHLSEYYRRRFPPGNVAWIGSYPSLAAKLMSAATVLLAPAGVAIYLAAEQKLIKPGLIGRQDYTISALAALVSIALSVITGITYWRGTRPEPLRNQEQILDS